MRASFMVVGLVLIVALSGCDEATGDEDAGNAADAGSSGFDSGLDAGPGMDASVDGGSGDGGSADDAGSTDAGTTDAGRDTSCDDGDPLTCRSLPPTCETFEVLAVQDGCWVCVNATTCRPWGEAGCTTDMGCAATERCDLCASSSCPTCDDCVAGCVVHGCPTETTLTCRCARPDCGDGAVAVIRDGCWICVTLGSCSVVRDSC